MSWMEVNKVKESGWSATTFYLCRAHCTDKVEKESILSYENRATDPSVARGKNEVKELCIE